MIFRGLCVAALLFCSSPAVAQIIYVHAGKLIDVRAEKVAINQRIEIKGERIVAVTPWRAPPKGSKVINWSRLTLLPGLIDMHTHLADVGQSADVAEPLNTSPAATALIGARNARLTLMAGFTTVRDLGTYRGLTDIALRDAINKGHVPGPRMFVSGAYLTIPGGGGEVNGVGAVPPDMQLGVGRLPQEVAERATFLLKQGVDQLKLIATGAVLAIGTEPGTIELGEEPINAAVKVAETYGRYVTAHAHGADGIKAAIRGGARSIEHASLIDDEGIALAKNKNTWLVMDIYNGDYIEDIGTKEGWPAEYLRKNRETTDAQRVGFSKAVKAGVRLAFGTDSGVYPHGLNARQFRYMVKYGMTPMQALQSATINAATLMGKDSDVGSIAPARFADLIAVDGDVLADISVLENVRAVMKGGSIQRDAPTRP
jgi:imidazolonepropionase-like amidohydrolase